MNFLHVHQHQRYVTRSSHCYSGLRIWHFPWGNMGLIPGPLQWVKDLALPQLWCRSQMWLGFNHWLGNFQMPQVWPKKKKKKDIQCHEFRYKFILKASFIILKCRLYKTTTWKGKGLPIKSWLEESQGLCWNKKQPKKAWHSEIPSRKISRETTKYPASEIVSYWHCNI